MKTSPLPSWLNDARCYYSLIGEGSADPVSLFSAPDGPESPEALRLRLEPRSRFSARVRALDAEGREQGIIGSEGIIPSARYVMRRNGDPVWTLSLRSIVRKRHAFALASGETWTFDTPFFWWQQLTGTARGAPRLLGQIGPTTTAWVMWVEPRSDTDELLAAVAFLHRQWWHW